jgi:prepilin-type N-terminal cleavage/methylation domain-containing protein
METEYQTRPGRRAGLTLIEVILATAILGVGLVTLVAATGRCLAVARKAKEYETARRLIGQMDLEIPIELEEIEEGVERGEFTGEFRGYTWEREIEEFPEEDLELFVVRSTVRWTDKGREASEQVVTYIYGPTYRKQGVTRRR